MKQELGFLVLLSICCVAVDSKCSNGCKLALASYYIWPESDPTLIAQWLQCTTDDIISYNPKDVPNEDSVASFIRINVPFSCDCIDGEFLGRQFVYNVKSNDTYEKIANFYYANLTTVQWLQKFNNYDPNSFPDVGAQLNVTVNCSCGDSEVSKDYGLFVTYPLRPNESLALIANQSDVSEELLQKYNLNSNFSAGSGLVFLPGKDKNGNSPPLILSAQGLAGGVIAGISVAGVSGVLLLAICIYIVFIRKKKVMEAILFSSASKDCSGQAGRAVESGLVDSASPALTGLTVSKSVEFSYEELAKATDNFSPANMIGQGGFGSVYYAELRGEKAAIKKMHMQASKEFVAELKVLTRVHHLNLVRLIGYCFEGSLFVVYEYIENGNLSEHLHGSGRDTLPWSTRVQIALDSARGLEYIHEHTVPVYIHRDIKSANILIDKNFRGKVADFGLTKLAEVGSMSLSTHFVGTFGYISPEYARSGNISSKMDVYAFGVVLYELISAKKAIVASSGSIDESTGLVTLFEDVPYSREGLGKLVDPRLGDDYPFDSVEKMAQLAKACTHENPQLRPSMRSVVVSLTTLSSTTEVWEVNFLYENQALINLMSGC